MKKTKNLTVSLSETEFEDLDFLVDHFQVGSISRITRTDVIKHLIRQEYIKHAKSED